MMNKKIKFSALGLLILLTSACGKEHASTPFAHHWDPEMTGYDYQVALADSSLALASGVNDILEFGARNLAWIQHLNTKLKDKISLYSPATQPFYPIEQPNRYNESIVRARFESLKMELPEIFREILIQKEKFTDEIPMDREEFILWSRKCDQAYQIAARWTGLKSAIPLLKLERKNDVRGFVFFSREENLLAKLKDFDGLPESVKQNYSEWLVGLCINSGSRVSTCTKRLTQAIESKKVLDLYQESWPRAQAVYDKFFKLGARRRDVKWDETNLRMTVPFQTPETSTIQNFLSVNIQDEWRWKTFSLGLEFSKKAATEVQFRPNVTPNVNGLAGNIITLNSNDSLEDYGSKWVIRHEYGHVLGFPDCYVEFYDSEAKAIINYQIDTTNLMCSRRGKLQEKHFLELQAGYGS